MATLTVILGSVREGRLCEPVADWFVAQAKHHGRFNVEVADLKALNLPIMNEPHHPRLKRYVHESTKQWSATVAAADAFVFVMPEYNYTTPPAVVNALDTVYHEWTYKPVSFVTYGGVSGGLRAIQDAKLMVASFKMVPMIEVVAIPFVQHHLDNGVFKSNETHDKAVPVMLDEMWRWSEALKVLRPSA